MNYYRFPEKKPVKVGMFLYLFLLQILARSTMYTSAFVGARPAQVAVVGLAGIAAVIFLLHNRKNLKSILTDRRMIALAVAAVLILGPMLIKQDWQLMYFTILLCIFFAVFVTYFTTVEELGKYYVLIMAFLSVASLVGLFVLKPLVHAGVLSGNNFDSPGGWHMFHFGLTFVCDKNEMMHDTMRAFGIFREPGLFQVFLFIAIHLNNDCVRWDKQWHMWVLDGILFLSMLTSFATGGVLALGLYIVFLFFDKGLYRNRRMQILAVAAVIIGIVLIVYAVGQGGTWAYELVGMVEKIFDKNDSYTDRVDAIVSDAKYFFASPVFGSDMAEVLYAVPNNTATSPILFAVFGIVGGCAHVLSWVAFVWKKERHWIGNLILLVILFVPFNTQNVMPDMFFWLFPVMALTQRCLTAIPEHDTYRKAV